MEKRAISLPVFAKKHPSNYSPRLARGFYLLSAYQKATTKNVVANFILLLILQTLTDVPFFDVLHLKTVSAKE